MNAKLEIAVLGGGNSAQTMAAELALRGFRVNLCDLPDFAHHIETIMESKQIEMVGSVNGLLKVLKGTNRIRV